MAIDQKLAEETYNNVLEKMSNKSDHSINAMEESLGTFKDNTSNAVNNGIKNTNESIERINAEDFSNNIYNALEKHADKWFSTTANETAQNINHAINGIINDKIANVMNETVRNTTENITNEIQNATDKLAGDRDGFFGELRYQIVQSAGGSLKQTVHDIIPYKDWQASFEFLRELDGKTVTNVVDMFTKANFTEEITNVLENGVSGAINNLFGNKPVSLDKLANRRSEKDIGYVGGAFDDFDEVMYNNYITATYGTLDPILRETIVEDSFYDQFRDNPSSNYTSRLINRISEDSGMIMDLGLSEKLDKETFSVLTSSLEINNLSRLKTYVFFLRPDLNLFNPNKQVSLGDIKRKVGKTVINKVAGAVGLGAAAAGDAIDDILNPDLQYYPELRQMVKDNPALAAELCLSVGTRYNALWPFLSNHCEEVPPISINIDPREGTKNMYGKAGDVIGITDRFTKEASIQLIDNRFGEISKMLHMWNVYNDCVTRKGLRRDIYYIGRNMVDSAISMYLFTVDVDNIIIAHGKYTGVLIKNEPTQMIQHKADGLNPDEVNRIDLQISIFRPRIYDPFIFNEFNFISGFNHNYIQPLRSPMLKLWAHTDDSSRYVSPALPGGTPLFTITNENKHLLFPNNVNRLEVKPIPIFANKPGVVWDSTINQHRLVFSA